ncbi:MAG: YitT family protein [Lachnospiraceae bacterium]|nr:YitT family protein [Lachnospiraceae bacterium]
MFANKRGTVRSGVTNFTICCIASLIYCLGINFFILPGGLYSGGFTGISQLLSLFAKGTRLEPYNIKGAIYFILNIPIMILGWRVLGSKPMLKAGFTILLESALMSFLPIPNEPIISDTLTNTIVGGFFEGVGCGLLYIGFGSGGGTDTIGIVLSRKFHSLSIGKVSLAINIVVYAVCAIVFNPEVAVYSIIAAFCCSLVIDKIHLQNRAVTVNVFTNRDREIGDWIRDNINRSATVFTGTGVYSGAERKLVISVMSEYEYYRLKRTLPDLDPTAFANVYPSSAVLGDFEKRLS